MPVAYPVIFTPAARVELIEAQDWSEREATGVGRRFRQAIDALVERMSSNPQQFPVVYKNVRRALLRRFPYSLFFVLEDDALFVIAIFMPAATLRTGNAVPDIPSFKTASLCGIEGCSEKVLLATDFICLLAGELFGNHCRY